MSWQSAARFYRQLAMITKTGISMAQAITMAGGVAGGWHGQRAPSWSEGCSRGSDLGALLAADHENPLAVALVMAGEKSGRVPEMGTMLADYFDHLLSLRTLIITRLIYPLCLLHVALIVPNLIKVVSSGAPLYQLLLYPFLFWVLVAVLSAVLVSLKRSGALARLALSHPLRMFAMPLIEANTYRVVRAGLAAGLLIPDTLELAAGACGNRAMRARLEDAGTQVRNGLLPDLTGALVACDFPATPVSLIKNAEFAGRLEEVLLQVATLAEENFRTRSLYAAKIFTGTIYTIAAVTAAAVIISVYAGYIGQIKQVAGDDGN